MGTAGEGYGPEDLKDLVNLRITREKRLARAHLGEDATNRPHIDSGRILTTTKENLGSAVPQGDDLMGVGAKGDTEGAGETKIRQLEVTLTIN